MNTKQLTGTIIGVAILALIVGILFARTSQPPLPTASENIRVTSPRPNEKVGLPLVIKGEARVFENTFLYRLLDADGSLLFQNHAMANAPDVGQFGPFALSVNYPTPKGDHGTLEVFSGSPKDGSEINKVIIPVRFAHTDSLSVKAFFGNTIQNPNAIDCAKVYPVTRRIPVTIGVARAALEELLKGTSAAESQEGFHTEINSGTALKSLTIQNGVAHADFSELLELHVGGACRVTAIRAQIEETLKQFPTVQSVIISIEGRSEDILQP